MFLAFVDCIVCADQQQEQRTNHTTSPVIVLSHCGIITGWQQQQGSLGQLQWLVLTPSIVFGGHLFSLLFHAHSPPMNYEHARDINTEPDSAKDIKGANGTGRPSEARRHDIPGNLSICMAYWGWLACSCTSEMNQFPYNEL